MLGYLQRASTWPLNKRKKKDENDIIHKTPLNTE